MAPSISLVASIDALNKEARPYREELVWQSRILLGTVYLQILAALILIGSTMIIPGTVTGKIMAILGGVIVGGMAANESEAMSPRTRRDYLKREQEERATALRVEAIKDPGERSEAIVEWLARRYSGKSLPR